MYEIKFGTQTVKTAQGINFFGEVKINEKERKVICSVSYEFLQDINNGCTDYDETFKSNLWTIELIADEKLNSFGLAKLVNDPLHIDIVSSDKKNDV